MNHGERKRWLDDPGNVRKVIRALYVVCGVLLAIDALYHKHVHYDFEKLFGFYAFYGLIGSVGLVLLAKAMRKILMRDEDYYDR